MLINHKQTPPPHPLLSNNTLLILPLPSYRTYTAHIMRNKKPGLLKAGIKVYSKFYIEAILNSSAIFCTVLLIFSYCLGPAFAAPEAY